MVLHTISLLVISSQHSELPQNFHKTSGIIKWKLSSSPAPFPVQESLWQCLCYLCRSSDTQGWGVVILLKAAGSTVLGALWA